MKILFLTICVAVVITACGTLCKASDPTVFNNGVHIDYTDTRKGDTTLLFVHGWCIDKTYFNNQVDHYKTKYRVVAMDLAGYGKSGKNRSSWKAQNFAADVDAVITLNLKKIVLIGHSMAGDVVLESAIHNPNAVIAIVGIDNFKNSGIINPDSVKSQKEYRAAIYQLKHNFRSVAYPYVTQQLLYKTTPLAVRKKVLYDLAHADTIIAAASMDQDNLEEATELIKAKKPLFIISSDVNKTDTSGLHANHVNTHLYYVNAVGHYPMIEKPSEFNQCLSQALADLKRLGNHSPKS